LGKVVFITGDVCFAPNVELEARFWGMSINRWLQRERWFLVLCQWMCKEDENSLHRDSFWISCLAET